MRRPLIVIDKVVVIEDRSDYRILHRDLRETGYNCQVTPTPIVHFKRLGSRHFVKEMKIQGILPKYNNIFRKTNLKPFLNYIQKVSNISIMKFDAFESSLMHICSKHNFAHCVFQYEHAFLFVMTSISI